MICRLGTPPSKVEEWTAGVPVHYRTVIFLSRMLCFVFEDVVVRLVLCIRLGRFEDSAEFPKLYFILHFSAYMKMYFKFSAFSVPLLKGPVKLLSG